MNYNLVFYNIDEAIFTLLFYKCLHSSLCKSPVLINPVSEVIRHGSCDEANDM